ncbi:Ribosomal RNA processing protein 1B, partial [Galemys pyrenaicus]
AAATEARGGATRTGVGARPLPRARSRERAAGAFVTPSPRAALSAQARPGGGLAGDAAAGATAPAMQPAEIQFAQRLASHEKGIRERAARKLRQYLSVKTQRETARLRSTAGGCQGRAPLDGTGRDSGLRAACLPGGFSQEELLKIWKGLFYCMWVQEEPLLQEELAVTISHLVHVVHNSEAQHLFLQTFWQTLNREWAGIDRPRLDKYHMLIRLVLRQSLEVLKRNGWEDRSVARGRPRGCGPAALGAPGLCCALRGQALLRLGGGGSSPNGTACFLSRIQLFLDVLMKEVLRPESQSPNGVRFHFIDIYLDELSKVGGKELLADQNLKFIDPFCKVAAKTKDHTLVQTIARAVFEAIVHQCPLVPEETVAGLRVEVGDDGPLAGEPPAGETAWSEAASAPAPGCGRPAPGDDQQEEHPSLQQETALQTGQKIPRPLRRPRCSAQPRRGGRPAPRPRWAQAEKGRGEPAR